MWQYRERINYYEKVRRSLYEVLRDALQVRLMRLSLVDSFYNFLDAGEEYSFVEKSELKPKSKRMEKESDLFRTFIVIFCEEGVGPELKNYLRFFPENKLVKKNVEYLADVTLYESFHQNLKYFERIIIGTGALLMLWPGTYTHFSGLAIFLVFVVIPKILKLKSSWID